jgi:hypothetical protein
MRAEIFAVVLKLLNSLLLELLSHNVDGDAARGKQKLSRSDCS